MRYEQEIFYSLIVTFMWLCFLVFCILDNTTILYSFCMYAIAMAFFALPMSFFMSVESELIRMDLDKELVDIESIEQIIQDKTKRELTYEDDNKRVYQMKNRYNKWLTNEVTLENVSDRIYLIVPNAYKKHFVDLMNNEN